MTPAGSALPAVGLSSRSDSWWSNAYLQFWDRSLRLVLRRAVGVSSIAIRPAAEDGIAIDVWREDRLPDDGTPSRRAACVFTVAVPPPGDCGVDTGTVRPGRHAEAMLRASFTQ